LSAHEARRGAEQMNYSVKYLNAGGITERSEFLPFNTDAEANEHARIELPRHFIVEVWKADALLSRTFRDPQTH
jgi:hypothetical protein